MAKKVWISLPLTTTADATDQAVTGFTKGGPKKELEVETAAFIMKWLIDRNLPFGIDFESLTVDRNHVFEALPRRLQRALGYKATGTAEPAGDEAPAEGAETGGSAAVELRAEPAEPRPAAQGGGDLAPEPQPAGDSPFGEATHRPQEPRDEA
jgi:hypothetical protein